MTQRIFSEVAHQSTSVEEDLCPIEPEIDEIVSKIFFGSNGERDSNLQFVKDMLVTRSPNIEETLRTYLKIANRRLSVLDDKQSIIKSHLKLSGIIKSENSLLQVRNPIYQNVFDHNWIKIFLKESEASKNRQLNLFLTYLSLATYGICISLWIAIIVRLLGSGIDQLTILTSIFLSILIFMKAFTEFTKLGRRKLEEALNSFEISINLYPAAKLLMSTSLLTALIAFRGLALPRLSEYYNDFGIHKYSEGQLSLAEEYFQRALSIDSSNLSTHFNLGNVYENWSRFEEAEKAYRVAISGGMLEAYNNLAVLLIKDESYAEAATILEAGLIEVVKSGSSIQKNSEYRFLEYILRTNLGWVRFEQGRYEESQDSLLSAIAISDGFSYGDHVELARPHCLLATVLSSMERSSDAVANAEKCVRLVNTYPRRPEEDSWFYAAKQILESNSQ